MGRMLAEFFLSLFLCLRPLPGRSLAGDQVGESGVIENAGGRVADIEKYLVKRAMRKVAINQIAQDARHRRKEPAVRQSGG